MNSIPCHSGFRTFLLRDMTPWCVVSLFLHLVSFATLLAATAGWVRSPLPPPPLMVELRDTVLPAVQPTPVRQAPNPAPPVKRQTATVVPISHPVTVAPGPVQPALPVTPVAEIAPAPLPARSAIPVMSIPAPPQEPVRRPPPPPTASVPSVAVRPITPAAEGEARSRYLSALKAAIEKYKEYPVMARKGGMEGTAVIRFVLSRSGGQKSASLVRSSGVGLLDAAALRAVKSAGRFPPVPDDISGSEVVLDVPLTFRLTGR
jgi:protein TonB